MFLPTKFGNSDQQVHNIRKSGNFICFNYHSFLIIGCKTLSSVYILTHASFVFRRINSLDVGHLVPIQLLLNKCLYPGIISRYQHVCRHLLEVLKTDYHLLNYFAAMRVRIPSLLSSFHCNGHNYQSLEKEVSGKTHTLYTFVFLFMFSYISVTNSVSLLMNKTYHQ